MPAQFSGSISGNILRVSSLYQGSIRIGETILANRTLPNTVVVMQQLGSLGGIGQYWVNTEQTVEERHMMSRLL